MPTSVAHAFGANGLGQVVGQAGHAALFADGDVIDLDTQIPPDTGWILEQARAINDRGQIVGRMIKRGDGRVYHAFLLTPRP